MRESYTNYEINKWIWHCFEHLADFPFCFTYNGKRYEGFTPKNFELLSRSHTKKNKPDERENLVFKFLFDGCLEITLDCKTYTNRGFCEWTVWFKNVSDHDSGVISNPCTTLEFVGERPLLKGILGDHSNYYRPYTIDLVTMPGIFDSIGGRATHINFPYFNLEYGNGGSMLAIGWAGTWHADFNFDGTKTICHLSSVIDLNTYLKPGEKIRTALFVRGDYTVRDEHYATNFWRSWFVDCNLPKADKNGTELKPFSTCCLAGDTGLPNTDGSISERYYTWRPSMEKMLEEKIDINYRWFDAGWYIAPDGTSPETDWWDTVGTWELDKNKWPDDTFLQSTEFARQHGMKTFMWFEPERTADPDNLAKTFGYNREWAIKMDNFNGIYNNLSDPACYRWTLERIKKTLKENKIEMYREDNNITPDDLWIKLDAMQGKNRRGITECKAIDTHYHMWDEIIKCTLSYGGCGFVDSCASGGGRNDLESMRRGVPVLRSDSDRTTISRRLSMTSSFNKWIPFCGASTKEKSFELTYDGVDDKYTWRGSYLPVLNVSAQFVQAPNQDFDILRFGINEWKSINKYLLKEFYTLTPWHAPEDIYSFTAYAFYDEESKDGVMFAFRQEIAFTDTLHIKLPFLTEGQTVTLTDEDTKEVITVSYDQLKKAPLALKLENRRMAKLYRIATIE